MQKKKFLFFYPDSGSNRIFFNQIIIWIKTMLSGYPKKFFYSDISGWIRIRIEALSIITIFKMVYSQILLGLRFSSHVLTVLYPSLLSHKSIGYTHHFKFSMNFMFSANLLINFSIFILPCNNTTYYLSIS